jgi:hypothetical protein
MTNGSVATALLFFCNTLSICVAGPSYLNSVRMYLSQGIYRGDEFKRNYDNVNYKTLNFIAI